MSSSKDRARAGAEARAPRTNAPPRTAGSTREVPPAVTPARVAAYVALVVLGALVSLAGSLLHDAWFPGGLLLSLAAAAGVFSAGRMLTRTQFGALAPAAGWLVGIVLLLGGRPEGDYVYGDSVALLLFMLGGMVVAVICATTSRLPVSATDGG
ncbi:DUF6113 family protein [uncultured Streptomyces sp.]|uniref:DUF6113 family protein n=1 Tax=uncultured Streptomyces sp. TaxID=174707 RepID=UPI002632E358|nr:DUF6113 family protein [uncultured Streptomyces sp.]